VPRKTKTPRVQDKTATVIQGVYWLPSDATWGGFINIRLQDDAKLAFNAWWETHPNESATILDDLLGEGAKFGVSYDRQNECYVSTLMGALVEGSNERYCVTTRAGSLSEVIALTVWKHAYYAKGDYGSFRPATSKLDSWG